MAKFPESADALDDDFELDGGLVATDDEDENEEVDQPEAGPSKKRVLQAISDEEDNFALDDQDEADEDTSDQQRVVSEQEEDEYGLPVNRAVKEETERLASSALGTTATKEDKKRKRKEKVKEAKVLLLIQHLAYGF
jgi:hypothetical protein